MSVPDEVGKERELTVEQIDETPSPRRDNSLPESESPIGSSAKKVKIQISKVNNIEKDAS